MSEVRKSKKRRNDELRYGLGAGRPVEPGGVIKLYGGLLEWLSPGTTLTVQLGAGLAMLTPLQPGVGTTEEHVATVNQAGDLTLPDAVLKALSLTSGDSVQVWNEGRRVFIERCVTVDKVAPDKIEEPVPKSQPRRQLYETVPPHALPLAQRRLDSYRRHGWAEEAGSARYDASLQRVPKPDDRPWRGETWVAIGRTSIGSPDGIPRDVRGEGKTILQALSELTQQLQEAIRHLYIQSPTAQASLRDMRRPREPEADVRPVYPPEVEAALERFREGWSTAAPEDRERMALRPAVLQIADLGLASVDIAWILQVDQEDVEAYLADPLQELFHHPKQETHRRPLP